MRRTARYRWPAGCPIDRQAALAGALRAPGMCHMPFKVIARLADDCKLRKFQDRLSTVNQIFAHKPRPWAAGSSPSSNNALAQVCLARQYGPPLIIFLARPLSSALSSFHNARRLLERS